MYRNNVRLIKEKLFLLIIREVGSAQNTNWELQ